MGMRFTFRPTNDGSLTVFDLEAGECFKSRHAARLEAETVFFSPGVANNPWYGNAEPFRVLELGFGLGTNFLYCLERGFKGEYITVERDLAGSRFYLDREPNASLTKLVGEGFFESGGLRAKLLEDDFFAILPLLHEQGFQAHAIFFDPFSPKSNPDCWTPSFFRLVASLLAPGGRLVSYSVSRGAKDGAAAAGLVVEKHKLPSALKKRSALLAIKPIA